MTRRELDEGFKADSTHLTRHKHSKAGPSGLRSTFLRVRSSVLQRRLPGTAGEFSCTQSDHSSAPVSEHVLAACVNMYV